MQDGKESLTGPTEYLSGCHPSSSVRLLLLEFLERRIIQVAKSKGPDKVSNSARRVTETIECVRMPESINKGQRCQLPVVVRTPMSTT